MGENQTSGHERSEGPKGSWLSIGEFARRSLLSPKALRLYDRLDVLTPAEVDPGTGYRRYRESQLETARLIARLRHLDMPLAQVGEIVAMPQERRSDALIAYWESVERRMAGQREVLMYLLIALAGKERSFDMFDVQVRDVPDQLVLTEQRHVTVDDLPDWMESAFGRMWDIAPRFGGVTAPVIAIFHGQVNAESDGPVEICAPISAVQEIAPDVPTRIEPAHQEAYTRIRNSQVAFPEILSAYDAVEQWIMRNGKVSSGPPREVYFADFMNARADEEVVDIAFPIERADGQG
jgi:DNA-binding transcriptional MerR regulator/effector-binding domain-containing protein